MDEIELARKRRSGRRKGDHDSSVHPDIPNDPNKTNWVEQEGGLPSYMARVAKHIMADSGYTRSRAIAAAVSQTRKRAAQGNAEAARAYALWLKRRASAKARPNKRRSRNLATELSEAIELARRGPYQRHVKHTKQFGKKKGDLSSKADWEHGYKPKTQVAMAVKAKHLDADDLTSSGKPKRGKEKALRKPVPPHLAKFKGKVRGKAARKSDPAEKKSS